MKIHFFDLTVRKTFGSIVSGISILVSFLVIIYPLPDTFPKWLALVILTALFIILYICTWLYIKYRRQVSITINNTKVIIREGDLFQKKGNKVIPANDYFDTIVGDGIVDPKSLHAKYIKSFAQATPDELNDRIRKSLSNKALIGVDLKRPKGNQNRYKLGTIYDDQNGFFLLAFARYDNDNKATLTEEEIMSCYLNMWKEIDTYKGSASVSIPVMGGSKIVRGKMSHFTPQQLIELILWTFRINDINLCRGATLNIVIHKSMMKEINLTDLKKYSD